jgi:hypothetical protein
VAIVSLVLAGALLRRPAPVSPSTVRFVFDGTDSAQVLESYPWPATISPDGNMLVYSVAESRTGGTLLYARRLDQIEARAIPGTSNAYQPLFSPDGQWLAFETTGKERKVRLDGSAPVTIADGGNSNGADWSTSDELVLGSTGKLHGLSHVNVAGGDPAPITRPDSTKGEVDHLWPIVFPDGRTIAFTVWSGTLATSQLALTSLGDGVVTRLGIKGIRPLAVLDRALLYVQEDGAVMAVPLDASRKRLASKPVAVLVRYRSTGSTTGIRLSSSRRVARWFRHCMEGARRNSCGSGVTGSHVPSVRRSTTSKSRASRPMADASRS